LIAKYLFVKTVIYALQHTMAALGAVHKFSLKPSLGPV